MPGFPPSGDLDDINIVLTALLKILPGIEAEELKVLFKDLPMPEPAAKGGISAKEAAEVCFVRYIVCYIIYYILCYGCAAWPFARVLAVKSERPSRISYKRCCTTLTLILKEGQPRMVSVCEAETRR